MLVLLYLPPPSTLVSYMPTITNIFTRLAVKPVWRPFPAKGITNRTSRGDHQQDVRRYNQQGVKRDHQQEVKRVQQLMSRRFNNCYQGVQQLMSRGPNSCQEDNKRAKHTDNCHSHYSHSNSYSHSHCLGHYDHCLGHVNGC